MNLVVLGNGGHSHSVCDVAELCGYSVSARLENEEQALEYAACAPQPWFFVAVGDNWKRAQIVQTLRARFPEIRFATLIHPGAVVSRYASLGEGTVVMGGAVINSHAVVGKHCIINTRSSVDHDCLVCDFASLAPGATLGGGARVGDFAAVGLNAGVIHKIQIGAHAVIGAGAAVVRDVRDYAVVCGVPGREIRQRGAGERYL